MKKSILFFLLLLAAAPVFAKKVKFAVDMTGQVVDTAGVHVTGDFQALAGYAGGDWMPNTTVMTQEVSDTNIYSVIVDIPAFRVYEFKFLNGDQTYNVEFVPYESRVLYNFNDNRWIYIDSLANDTTTFGPVVFGANAPLGKYLLRFRVDMTNVASVSTNGVHVGGAFQNWDAGATRMYSFDGTMYEYIAYVDTGMNSLQHEFKYANGNTSSDYETVPSDCAVNGNRATTVPKDSILESVCFGYCTNCLSIGIHEQQQVSKLLLSPNPTSDYSLLQINDREPAHEISIADVSGRCVRIYSSYEGNALCLEKGELGEGLYIITVRGNSASVSTVKWFVQ
jgi:hypothetical protein